MAKKRKLNRKSKKGGNDNIDYQTVEDYATKCYE